ncbi:MAG: hypothetical protein LBK66_00815 [Spirochaetaceae bacterium]|nr:hypothetical protein [Spirochaetaceae bacterium]
MNRVKAKLHSIDPLAGADRRVCQAPLPDPEARSKGCFGYTGAERTCLHGKWRARMPSAVAGT